MVCGWWVFREFQSKTRKVTATQGDCFWHKGASDDADELHLHRELYDCSGRPAQLLAEEGELQIHPSR